jgi:hypothetical protein
MLALARRTVTVILGTVLLLVLGHGLAWADCHGDGDNSGSGTQHVGAAANTEHWTWDLSSREIFVQSDTSSLLNLDDCMDANVDWMTSTAGGQPNGGHYDSRTARDCKPSGFRQGTITEPSGFDGCDVTGLQKAAGCRYNQDTGNETGCLYDGETAIDPDTGQFCHFNSDGLVYGSLCHAIFIRYENGTSDFNGGSDVNTCNG